MAGINLSQSLQEKEAEVRGSFVDTGLYINLAILFLVLAVFGGGRWYLSSLNKQLASLDNQIVKETGELHSPDVDRIADFHVRLDMVRGTLKGIPEHQTLFAVLETKLVPNTRLTLYEEDWAEGTVTLSGITESLKYVAQEMLALKTVERVKQVSVNTLSWNDDGELEFSLDLVVAKAGVPPSP